MHDSTNPTRSIPDPSRTEIRSAATHAAQASLLLRRVCAEMPETDELRVDVLDLAGVLHFVVVAIAELGATR